MLRKLLAVALLAGGVVLAFVLSPSPEGARAAGTADCSQCHDNVVSSFTASPVDRLTVCRTCHTSVGGPQHASVVETAYGWFASEQSPLAGPELLHAGGVHVYKSQGNIFCDRCHATASCRACHQEVPHGQHGSSEVQPVTQVTTLGGYSNFPAEETFSCGTSQCHTTLPEVARYRPDGTDLCYNCHPVGKSGHGDLAQVHNSNFVPNPPTDCSSCHQAVLTDEHLSRADAQGNPYTCATCHNSARTEVQQAIANNQTNCDACHTIHADVTAVHASSFVANPQVDCSSCHQGVLTDEHLSRVDAQGNPYTCATCHNSARAEVQQAIANNQTNCDACHTIHADVTTAHASGFVANPQMDCSSCHQAVLTDEHLSRADAQGNPYTCGTCHNSARAEVQQAIANNQTNCDACHTVHGDLNVVHRSSQPSSCLECHNASLTATHKNDCSRCHAATSTQVRQAVDSGNTACGACHQTYNPTTARKYLTASERSLPDHTNSCNLCHSGKSASVASTHQKHDDKATCGTCHAIPATSQVSQSSTAYCSVCHGSAMKSLSLPSLHQRHSKTRTTPQPCAMCHGRSVPAISKEQVCRVCHGTSKSYPRDWSSTSRHQSHRDVPCASCHRDETLSVDPGSRQTCERCHSYKTYSSVLSLHGKHMGKAWCVSCHGSDATNKFAPVRDPGQRLSCSGCHATKPSYSSWRDVHKKHAGKQYPCATCHGTVPPGYGYFTGSS